MKPGTEVIQGLVFLTIVAVPSFVINFVDKHPRLLSICYLACSRPFCRLSGAAVEL